ncbi:hypothetical protein F4561_004441 [Lipingzhangella halophila]|uniref:Tox-REase-3 domain-containing protein n=1 Tax=Lipingzhangella halophila TaxID=1783352 RepID=A0A7W7RKH5_9ACTN|nr:hypothetical protein [Lipingzhangella halophila]
MAQAKLSRVQVNKTFRNQAKAAFEAASQSGRSVYYHFQGGPLSPEVRSRLEEYANRYGVDLVIDDTPFDNLNWTTRMFEIHGWITIQEPGDNDVPSSVRNRIQDLVEVAKGGNALVDLSWMNGQLTIHFGGFSNHRSPDIEELLSLFLKAGEIAKGSYGLLYYHDDEEEDPEGRNSFKVMVMRHGRVTNERDTLLSPVIPTIESPDVPGQ